MRGGAGVCPHAPSRYKYVQDRERCWIEKQIGDFKIFWCKDVWLGCTFELRLFRIWHEPFCFPCFDSCFQAFFLKSQSTDIILSVKILEFHFCFGILGVSLKFEVK